MGGYEVLIGWGEKIITSLSKKKKGNGRKKGKRKEKKGKKKREKGERKRGKKGTEKEERGGKNITLKNNIFQFFCHITEIKTKIS